MKFGLIAGNGQFPFLVVEGARKASASLAVVAIKEETDPSISKVAENVTWVSIGQLSRMILFFKDQGVTKAIMAGQVKHVQIFSGAMPDLRKIINDTWGITPLEPLPIIRQDILIKPAKRHGGPGPKKQALRIKPAKAKRKSPK